MALMITPVSPISADPSVQELIHSVECLPSQPVGRPIDPISELPKLATIDNEHPSEVVLLTEKNLELLAKQGATPDSSPTLVSSEEDGKVNEASAKVYQNSLQGMESVSLSQSSFAGPAVSPITEEPCSAETLATTHTPHQCALGIDCLLEINNLNYHRVLATSLVTRARLACLSVRPINPDDDYDDIARLRGLSRHSAKLLQEHYVKMLKRVMSHFERLNLVHRPTTRTEMLNPVNIMKEIQFPEYWETERRYLENPGCLLERQKAAVSIEPLPCSSSEVDNRKLLGDGPQTRLTGKRKLAEVDPKTQENMSKRRRSTISNVPPPQPSSPRSPCLRPDSQGGTRRSVRRKSPSPPKTSFSVPPPLRRSQRIKDIETQKKYAIGDVEEKTKVSRPKKQRKKATVNKSSGVKKALTKPRPTSSRKTQKARS
ncbi:hypothetical protein LOZ55_006116 [Ophidiomyces ophidiicola]|nr:hypothetical protein LOZ55_006116 [Ophidiomyces ophidiicola]KAI1985975.1 hypothetical protein LOZ54_004046 [Ophidiomyces ophidiicola]